MSPVTKKIYDFIRKELKIKDKELLVENDRVMYLEFEKIRELIHKEKIVEIVEDSIGELILD